MQFLQSIRQWTMDDIRALEDYLNSFDGIKGEHRYISACAGCHGVDARGGRVREDVKGENGREILEAIREEGDMAFLGCLPASDIREIGRYLQSLDRDKRRGGDDDRRGGDDDRVREDRRSGHQ